MKYVELIAAPGLTLHRMPKYELQSLFNFFYHCMKNIFHSGHLK